MTDDTSSPYELVETLGKVTLHRIADDAWIPDDPGNADYQRYLAWVKQGNEAPTVDKATPPLPKAEPKE